MGWSSARSRCCASSATPCCASGVTAATDKVEAYNGYTGWLRFGNAGVIAANDPVEQEKTIKFNQLLANCAMFHTTVDMWPPSASFRPPAGRSRSTTSPISPYATENFKRLGDYPTDELSILPADFDPHLDIELATDANI